MRFIPTKVHGVLDYSYGVVLAASPWLFGFSRGGMETWLPVVFGVAVLLQSAMTNYELGLIRKIPMMAHLSSDLILGIVLALSPWVFGFKDIVWVPHLIFGIIAIFTSTFTKTIPGDMDRKHPGMPYTP